MYFLLVKGMQRPAIGFQSGSTVYVQLVISVVIPSIFNTFFLMKVHTQKVFYKTQPLWCLSSWTTKITLVYFLLPLRVVDSLSLRHPGWQEEKLYQVMCTTRSHVVKCCMFSGGEEGGGGYIPAHCLQVSGVSVRAGHLTPCYPGSGCPSSWATTLWERSVCSISYLVIDTDKALSQLFQGESDKY